MHYTQTAIIITIEKGNFLSCYYWYLTNIRFFFVFEKQKIKILKYSLMAICQLRSDMIYVANECAGSVVFIARNNYFVTVCETDLDAFIVN